MTDRHDDHLPAHEHDHAHPHTHLHTHLHGHPHNHGDDGHHDGPVAFDRRTVLRRGALGLGALLVAACTGGADRSEPTGSSGSTTTAQGDGRPSSPGPATTSLASPGTSAPAPTGAVPNGTSDVAAAFAAFASTVRVVASGDLWLIESSGMPAHRMMVGIRSWQQQVPLPQPYTGTNAWQLPRRPVRAAVGISARTALYRGAIALAVNGVPIFNALNNRGDDAYLAGELDDWGGHAGRADDYHYHVAPWHLLDVVGSRAPLAFALDGYPIYGEVEPDGSPVRALDEFNGHDDGAGGYHYHGTRTFPYINGGLRGVVRVQDDQISPQPAASPARPATTPLRGATITGFDSIGTDAWRLVYDVAGTRAEVAYRIDSSSVRFDFRDPSGATRTETYVRR